MENMMTKKTLDMKAVKRFWNHYQMKVVSQPDLYRSTDTVITVVLPQELLEFSEHRSGHHGYEAGCLPLGIRRSVNDSSKTLAEIFESVDSLAAFIRTSEADGLERLGEYKREASKRKNVRHLSSKETKILRAESKAAKHLDQPTDTDWTNVWDNYPRLLLDLAAYYGKDTVLQDKKNLTVEEFGLRYGLPLPRRQ